MTTWYENIAPIRWYRKQSWWVRTLITPFIIVLPFFLIVFPAAGPIVIPFYIVFPLLIGTGLILYQEPQALSTPSILPRMDQGEVLLEIQQFDGAVQAYTQIITDLPEYHRAYVMRAVAYRNLGQLDAAEKDIDKALTLKPGDTRARSEQARLKSDRGNTQR